MGDRPSRTSARCHLLRKPDGLTSERAETPPAKDVQTLHADGSLCLKRYVSRAKRGIAHEEDSAARQQIVFVLGGVFVRRGARGTDLGAPNQVLFFDKDAPYQVDHPDAHGDDSLIVELPDEDWQAWVRARRPSFWLSALCPPPSFLGAWRLVAALRAPRDPAGVRQAVYDLLDSVGTPASRQTHRGTRDLVEAVRIELARRAGGSTRLTEVARAFGVSSYYLCHAFRAQVGMPPHAYLRRLRVREAVRRLDAGLNQDLTSLALELGFFDHSHFTRAFRSEFGVPPSSWRRLAREVSGPGLVFPVAARPSPDPRPRSSLRRSRRPISSGRSAE